MSSPNLSVSGLASGFNWQSFIDKIIAADSYPVTRMQSQQTTNNQQLSARSTIGSQLTDLKTSGTVLTSPDIFKGRNAVSTTSASTWTVSAANGTLAGNYTFAVSQIATTANRTGTSSIAKPLSPTTNVSGLTISTLPLANAV